MGDPWGIGGFKGGGEAQYQANSQKTVKKSQKSAKSGKNRNNRIFY